jgi:hypothetical protein
MAKKKTLVPEIVIVIPKLTLMTLAKEVQALKQQVKPITVGSSSQYQSESSSSVKPKKMIKFPTCVYCGYKNHLAEDCYNNLIKTIFYFFFSFVYFLLLFTPQFQI